ncbi:MAG: FAD binding domain-containing protein [Beijerinckiaceae bacterium]
MKSAAFDYVRPASVAEACEILRSDEDARLIAGGQTLVPMMAMRLARPSRLVDISRLPELAGVVDETDAVAVGAATRQLEMERHPFTRTKLPLLAAALPWVGHRPTRSRGTVGGSVANADPAAEIPLVLATLGGEVEFMTADGPGKQRAADFFAGPMMTNLPAGAVLTRIRFPVWAGKVGVGFHEVSARRSDFAYVSACAQVSFDVSGVCIACVTGIGGAVPSPTRLEEVGLRLAGTRVTDADIGEALDKAIPALEIMTDHYATTDYRRRVARELAARALRDARERALGGAA